MQINETSKMTNLISIKPPLSSCPNFISLQVNSFILQNLNIIPNLNQIRPPDLLTILIRRYNKEPHGFAPIRTFFTQPNNRLGSQINFDLRLKRDPLRSPNQSR